MNSIEFETKSRSYWGQLMDEFMIALPTREVRWQMSWKRYGIACSDPGN